MRGPGAAIRWRARPAMGLTFAPRAFRSIRTNLLFSDAVQSLRTLVVTSPTHPRRGRRRRPRTSPSPTHSRASRCCSWTVTSAEPGCTSSCASHASPVSPMSFWVRPLGRISANSFPSTAWTSSPPASSHPIPPSCSAAHACDKPMPAMSPGTITNALASADVSSVRVQRFGRLDGERAPRRHAARKQARARHEHRTRED